MLRGKEGNVEIRRLQPLIITPAPRRFAIVRRHHEVSKSVDRRKLVPGFYHPARHLRLFLCHDSVFIKPHHILQHNEDLSRVSPPLDVVVFEAGFISLRN